MDESRGIRAAHSVTDQLPTITDVMQAQARLAKVIHRTPLDYAHGFSLWCNNEVYLKLENLQKTGAFKIRGAYNCIAQLTSEQRKKGVVAASAGNHAQGVALAATRLNTAATVVMPENAPLSKISATRAYGAKVVLAGATYDDAYQVAENLCLESGAYFVHAFDDPSIIAGQGTIALELLEELPGLEAVVVPVGGGGLVAGLALALKARKPDVKIIGVQAAGAPGGYLSYREGKIVEGRVNTFADGIAVRKPGIITFSLIRQYVDEIALVDEEEIARAVMMLMERAKLLVEGAGAVGLAALLAGRLNLQGKKTAVIISGGNIDINVVSTIIERGLAATGRIMQYQTVIADRPGTLQKLLALVAGTGANVINIYHDRIRPEVPLKEATVILTVETRDHAHKEEITGLLSRAGYILAAGPGDRATSSS